MVTHIFFDLCLSKHFRPVANFSDQSLCNYLVCFVIRGHFYVYVRVFLGFFEPPPNYVRKLLHKVRKNRHFLDHPPTPISLLYIKLAPNLHWPSQNTLGELAPILSPYGAARKSYEARCRHEATWGRCQPRKVGI